MKHIPLLILMVIVLGAGLTGAIAATHQPPAPVYSVTQVVDDLRHHPAQWRGRTVVVRGIAHLTGLGPLPSSPPTVALVDAPPAPLTIAGLNLSHLLAHLTGQRSPSPTAGVGVVLRQAPAAHQRLAFDVARTFRVRLGTVACPSGQCPVLTLL
jgi:hypothetical protein